MKINKSKLSKTASGFSKTLIGSLVGISLMTSSVFAAQFNLKFQSSDNAGNANYVLMQDWAKGLDKLTHGVVSIEMLPVNSIVKHTETLEAVGSGILDGHVTATGYFSGKDPAFGLLGNTVGA